MTQLLMDDPGGAEFAAKRLPNCSRGFDNPWCIGVFSHDNRIAAIVYSGWQPEAGVIEMSAVSDDPKWLSRSVLRIAFAYPFEALGAQLVVWRVSERNARTKKLAMRLGFVGHRIARLLGREEAQIVYTLAAETWAKGRYSGKANV